MKIQNTKNISNRECLIKENLYLVRKIVDKLKYLSFNGNINEEDLFSYGVIGLIEAVDKYQEAKGSLKSFLYIRIKGAIYDYLRTIDYLNRNSRKKVKDLSHAILELENRLQRTPSDEELANYLNINLNELIEIQKNTTMTVLSLDACIGTGDEDNNFQIQVADLAASPEENCEANILFDILKKTIAELPEKEKIIIGLYHFRKINMKEISKILGISESRVCQLHNRGIALLKNKLEKHNVEFN